MTNLYIDAARIRDAITDEGSHPRHHRAVGIAHRREWPTLWNAIDALMVSLQEYEADAEAEAK